MRTTIIIATTAVFSSIMTWSAADFHYKHYNSYAAERIISTEIALLEKTKYMAPPCSKLNASLITAIVDHDDVAIWKLSEDQQFIEKLVISNTFNSAYEQIPNSCVE